MVDPPSKEYERGGTGHLSGQSYQDCYVRVRTGSFRTGPEGGDTRLKIIDLAVGVRARRYPVPGSKIVVSYPVY
jgi:hypothetical protein